MESLIGYGSEDEFEEPTYRKKSMFRQADINYDEVQMELSEDSSNSPKSDTNQHYSKRKDTNTYAKYKDDRCKRDTEGYKSRFDQERCSPKSSKSEYKPRDKYRNEDDRSRYTDDKSRDYKKDRNYDDKDRRKDDRSKEYRRRDSHDSADRYKESKSYDSRESSNRDNKRYSREGERDRSYDSRDSNSRSSKTYDSRDNSSHDSKSDPRETSRNDPRQRKFSSPTRHRSRSPVHSAAANRSNNRDTVRSGYSSKLYDRGGNKIDRLEKLGIEFGSSSERASTSSHEPGNTKEVEKDRFYMPGITGRFTEQIQRRKMLWQKKDAQPVVTTTQIRPVVGQPAKVWQNTTFAQDTDGKVANKFKRLMGIKGAGATEPAKPATESLKKQEEMFSSMEAQYEVARTATHTMRGVGLGFSSFQR